MKVADSPFLVTGSTSGLGLAAAARLVEFALHIIENAHLSGGSTRLDGGPRMQAK